MSLRRARVVWGPQAEGNVGGGVAIASIQGRVEALEGLTLRGWALGADDIDQDLTLCLDGAPMEAAVRRAEREDVRVAFQSERLDLGFLIDLPPALWDRIPQEGAGTLSVQVGQQVLVSVPSMEWHRERLKQVLEEALNLHSAALTSAGNPEGLSLASRQLLRDHAHRAGLAACLPPDWVEEIPVRSSDESQPEAPPVQGQVEAMEGLLLRGWAATGEAGQETISLWLGDAPVDAAVVRVEREDVRRAVHGASALPGFEIEVPSQIWDRLTADQQPQIQVRVNGQVLPSAVNLHLSRRRLVDELWGLHALAGSAATAAGAELQRYQYRLFAAIEHAVHAALLPDLPPELDAFVQREAERFGLSALLAQGTGVRELLSQGGERDLGRMALWRAQRDFNQRWVSGRRAIEVLQETLSAVPLGEVTRQSFLRDTVPLFCSLRQYHEIRPLLDIAALREQGATDHASSVSLALPEHVASLDFTRAAEMVSRLLELPGWLNTECVGQAAWDLLQQSERRPLADEAVGGLVRALAYLISGLAKNPWARSHDSHLIDAQVSLLLMMPALPANLATEVLEQAERSYQYVPAFWTCLDRRWPDVRTQPDRLRRGRAVMQELQSLLVPPSGQAPDGQALKRAQALLRYGQARWQADALQISRELLLAAVPGEDLATRVSDMAAEAEGLGMEEVMRLAAHPLMDEQAELPSEALQAVVRNTGKARLPEWARWAWATWDGLNEATELTASPALPSLASCRRLNKWDTHFLGTYLATVRLALMAEQAPQGDGQLPEVELAELRSLWMSAWQERAHDKPLVAPLWNALYLLRRLACRWPDQAGWAALIHDFERCLPEDKRAASLLPEDGALRLRSPGWLQDTLVVVYSCRANLEGRVRAIRESWGRTLTEHGVPWVVLVGDGDGAAPEGMAGHVLALAAPDTYEHLPAKTLAVLDWVEAHTDFCYVYKIDDDCHLNVEAFLARSLHRAHHYMGRPLWRKAGDMDRLWHQGKSASARGASALDKSPEPSVYADGGCGYFVSRNAMHILRWHAGTSSGARLRLASFMEDKLVGDLLAGCGFQVSDQGYDTHLRRRFGAGATPVNVWHNRFYPGRSSPTWVTHLDEHASMGRLEAGLSSTALRPARLWPTLAAPTLGDGGRAPNQLELLSDPQGVTRLSEAPVILVAVARNEKTLMPHFLAHYRGLGVRHFVLVDNLSDDGTREYLLAQPDVVLYSADTDYRDSHYGVAWQQAVLGAHALGRWVVLADIDELLVYEDCERQPITQWLAGLQAQGHDAAQTLMVDMYPSGELAEADFAQAKNLFEAAPYFDRQPLQRWQLGAGHYSNAVTYLSALRHRLIPDSAPNLYTSQKIAVFRYAPWVRLAQGLHYASNLRVAPQPAFFAHFKYHAGFHQKVLHEIARKQHFNGAEEYNKYLAMLLESSGGFFDVDRSARWSGSLSFTSGVKGLIHG
ncbi:glycosyltransferase family 2 protein [Ideonella dechloratans]|uniref:glycosyltransferase family 2 protein n=1 Tax=Ideonella dechloratans TaxID=36863 RepID=UPI0035B102A7